MKYCVVNADDFGMSPGINRGILEAHEQGIVTSTSLIVNMTASEEAARLSRRVPVLNVGLHINLTGESADPIRFLDQYSDFQAELHKQLDAFQQLMGRMPTHLDSHQNVHRDPRLLPYFLAMASMYDLPLREHSQVCYFSNFYGQWDGETHPEQISAESLMQMMETSFGEGFTELSCHPGYVDDGLDSFYAEEREMELRTLCDPRIRRKLDELNIRLIRFSDLSKNQI